MRKLLITCSFLCTFCSAIAQPCTSPTVTVVKKEICQNENIQLVFTGAAPFELEYSINGIEYRNTVFGMDTAFVATQDGEYAFTVSDDGCSLANSKDGVEINGIVWAKYNVDAPGTFAKNPQDAGKFYQFNRKVGWAATGGVVNWPKTGDTGTTWEKENDPCPPGWRVPTATEQNTLGYTHTWTTNYNGTGVAGAIFGSGSNSIFLPAAGYRLDNGIGDVNFAGTDGAIWNNFVAGSEAVPNDVFYFGNSGFASTGPSCGNPRRCTGVGFMVRCVKGVHKETATVHPVKERIVSITICSGDSYLFNGKYYNTTGEYTFPLKTSFGCDSIVTLKLTVDESCKLCTTAPTLTIKEKEICQDDTIHLQFTGTAPFKLDYEFNATRQKITVWGMDTTLVATQPGKYELIRHNLVGGDGCSFKTTDKNGVEINGLVWAKYNVGKPNTFVDMTEDVGMFYQWNRKKAWAATGDVSGWDSSLPFGVEWEQANNPCPGGWRVPTKTELDKLRATRSKWITQNGINGREFGIAPNTIFLPAGGMRIVGEGKLHYDEENGYYASSTGNGRDYSFHLYFADNNILTDYTNRTAGQLVRCVKNASVDIGRVTPITVHSPKKETKTVTICSNESYFFNGKYLNTSGEYTAALKTSFGCDSIVTLNLTVNPAFYVEDSVAIRENELPITLHGTTFDEETQSGVYVLNHKTAQGCDSTVTLHLKVYKSIYIPGAFSPTNAAASVRIFKPVSYDLEYLHFWIYDKWGNLLWYSDELQNGIFTGAWNGIYDGRLLKADVYTWKIEAKFLNGAMWRGQKNSLGFYSNFGSVVLIR